MVIIISIPDRLQARGLYSPQHHEQKGSSDVGVLPTMTQLITHVVNLLTPVLPTLLTDTHCSPPLRLLLIILTPTRAVPALGAEGDQGLIRSKKSGKYRKGQAVQGKSILGDETDDVKGKGKEVNRQLPEELLPIRKEIIQALMRGVSQVEWKSMGMNHIGSLAVQLLLEIEIEDGRERDAGSLLDTFTEGLVRQLENGETPTAQVYLASLLAAPTGTRLLETILRVSPAEIVNQVWALYFEGKIGKLATHPFANFVVAQGVGRLDVAQIEQVVKECRAVAGGKGMISEYILLT